jgi:hypothetical protein
VRRAHPLVGVRGAAAGGWRSRSSFAVGGPTLLTEDRQKPRRLLDGMYGTRNTVPSRAARPSKRASRGRLRAMLISQRLP